MVSDATYLMVRPFRTLALLANFGPSVGLGHAMRSLAFCSSIKARFPEIHILWLTEGAENEAHALARTAGLEAGLTVVHLEEPIRELPLKSLKSIGTSLQTPVHEWLMVVDVYNVPTASWQAWGQSGAAILAIDDLGDAAIRAHGILNHGTKNAALYDWSHGPPGALALGARYALLRQPFASFPPSQTVPTKSVFISLGGSQMQPLIKQLLTSLLANSSLDGFSFTVVSKQALNFSDQPLEEERVNIILDPSPEAMLQAIDAATLCITSASTTAYEVCARRKPLIVLETVDNQRQLREYLQSSGLAFALILSELQNESTLNACVANALSIENQVIVLQAQSELFDGKQAERHADFAAEIWRQSQTLHIRKATLEDAELTFEWANDPDTRAAAFSQELIPWEDHKAYFKPKIADSQYHWYIISRHFAGVEMPIGQVRFAWTELEEDLEKINTQATVKKGEGCWTISYLVAPNWRGQRLAVPLLAAALKQLRAEGHHQPLLALVKSSNIASLRAFESLEFDIVKHNAESSLLEDTANTLDDIRQFWQEV